MRDLTDERPVLAVHEIRKDYVIRKTITGKNSRVLRAVDGVSFSIHSGETLSLVGESGCGKSTVGRVITHLTDATAGEITICGIRIDNDRAQLRAARRKIGFVFQDPYSSLNGRMRVEDIISEPIRNFGLESDQARIRHRVAELLETVGLRPDAASRYPHEFSGGQRQRICIARALAGKPSLLICDEAVSALDVSVKAQVVNLLQDLQRELGIAILFISHDLAIVEHLTDHVAVMYLGQIVEIGSRDQIFAHPRHPYTRALISAVPVPEVGAASDRIVLNGDVPSPLNPPSGCRFSTRCPLATDRCRVEVPLLLPTSTGSQAACHYAEEIDPDLLAFKKQDQ